MPTVKSDVDRARAALRRARKAVRDASADPDPWARLRRLTPIVAELSHPETGLKAELGANRNAYFYRAIDRYQPDPDTPALCPWPGSPPVVPGEEMCCKEVRKGMCRPHMDRYRLIKQRAIEAGASIPPRPTGDGGSYGWKTAALAASGMSAGLWQRRIEERPDTLPDVPEVAVLAADAEPAHWQAVRERHELVLKIDAQLAEIRLVRDRAIVALLPKEPMNRPLSDAAGYKDTQPIYDLRAKWKKGELPAELAEATLAS